MIKPDNSRLTPREYYEWTFYEQCLNKHQLKRWRELEAKRYPSFNELMREAYKDCDIMPDGVKYPKKVLTGKKAYEKKILETEFERTMERFEQFIKTC